MAGKYQWLTLSQAITQLGQRLNITPSTTSLWTVSELQIYITTALRMFNCLTWQWRADFTFSSPSLWNSLGSLPNSPRLRTVTDVQCYTELEYMLMEPPSGGTWTGTQQFNIADLSDALQSARDAIIEATNCNQVLMANIPITPNTIRTYLPNSTTIPDAIDVGRVRYLPVVAATTGTAAQGTQTISVASTAGIAKGQVVLGTGINYWSTVTGVGSGSVTVSLPTTGAVSGQINFTNPTTLYRDDQVANEFYQAPLYQQNPGTPTTFSLSSEPPLSWDVDIPPNLPGTYEAVVLQSGAPFNPPASTLLGIPDDIAWVAEWGALAELLGSEAEATDRERAAYAQQMYDNGLKLMTKMPWIELGKVDGVAVSCDSIADTDRYSPNWDSDPTGFGPVIVTGGPDWIAAPVGHGIGITCLGNAPVPVSQNDYVQISRAMFDTLLDICQSRAMFKLAGAEWKAALELEKRAIQACAAENVRLKSQGCFSDILDQRGTAQERSMNRYNSKQK